MWLCNAFRTLDVPLKYPGLRRLELSTQQCTIFGLCMLVMKVTLIAMLYHPILAWFQCKFTMFPTNYYTSPIPDVRSLFKFDLHGHEMTLLFNSNRLK